MTSSTPQDMHEPETQIDWRRPHPGFMLVEAAGTLRGLAVPFVVVVLGSGALSDPRSPRSLITLGLFVVLLLGNLIWNLMEWRFYRYALTPTRLLVRSGWISRQERSVPYQRVQSVDVLETPSYRLLGLARVRVETAAGGMGNDSEVDIRAVRHDQATAIREHLLRAREAARSEEPTPASGPVIEDGVIRERDDTPTTEGELVRTLSLRDLLIAGATSGTIGPAAAVIGGVISQADNLVPNTWWERVPWGRVQDIATNLTLLGVLIAIVAVLAWLMAIIGTVITYYGFELRRTDEHLLVQHGLLDKRRATIPVRRIQAIRLEEGILRQPFGLVTVKYSSAGRVTTDEGGSGTIFPFMPRAEVRALLEDVAPEFAVDVEANMLNKLPGRALRRYILGGTISSLAFSLLVIAGFIWWRGDVPWWGYLPLLLVPFEIATGWLAFRDAGWALDDRVLVLRSRSLARSTLVTTRRRVQHRSITANPFQRRARLVTLHVSVAGGGRTSLAHIDRTDGEQVLFGINPRATSVLPRTSRGKETFSAAPAG